MSQGLVSLSGGPWDRLHVRCVSDLVRYEIQGISEPLRLYGLKLVKTIVHSNVCLRSLGSVCNVWGTKAWFMERSLLGGAEPL